MYVLKRCNCHFIFSAVQFRTAWIRYNTHDVISCDLVTAGSIFLLLYMCLWLWGGIYQSWWGGRLSTDHYDLQSEHHVTDRPSPGWQRPLWTQQQTKQITTTIYRTPGFVTFKQQPCLSDTLILAYSSELANRCSLSWALRWLFTSKWVSLHRLVVFHTRWYCSFHFCASEVTTCTWLKLKLITNSSLVNMWYLTDLIKMCCLLMVTSTLVQLRIKVNRDDRRLEIFNPRL